MPVFELIPMDDALMQSATWSHAQRLKEYRGHIDQLRPGQMGRLRPTEDQTVHAVRRRLGAAASLFGKKLMIKQQEDEVYFWIRSDRHSKGRSRKPRKTADTNPS